MTPDLRIKYVDFSIQSEDDRKKLAVVIVNDYSGLEKGMSTENSLYDLRMGTTDKDYKCQTCKLGSNKCPGHLGRIVFSVPIVNVLFIDLILNDDNRGTVAENFNRVQPVIKT